MELEFWVTIDLGPHRNGDMAVTVAVSKKEYNLLKRCCREDEEIDAFEGLEKLCQRIIEAVKEESSFFDEDTEDVDLDDSSYTIAMPDEILDAVQN